MRTIILVTTYHDKAFKWRLRLRQCVNVTSTHTKQLFVLCINIPLLQFLFLIRFDPEFDKTVKGVLSIPDRPVGSRLVLVMGGAIDDISTRSSKKNPVCSFALLVIHPRVAKLLDQAKAAIPKWRTGGNFRDDFPAGKSIAQDVQYNIGTRTPMGRGSPAMCLGS